MANNMMSGLFGPSVEDIQRQRQIEQANAANAAATQDPLQRAGAQMYRAGGMLGDVLAKATGGVDPQIEKARQSEALLTQPDTDLTTSDGLLKKADQFRKMGDLRTATNLALRANEIRKQEAEMKRMNEPKNLPPEVQAMMALETLDPNSNQAKMIRQWLASKQQIEQAKVAKKVGGGGGGGGSIGSIQPELVKKMTREARLKAELDAGLIDQATYDAAISATPGGVLRQKQTDAINTSDTGFSAVEKNIDQLYDANTDKLKPAAKALFGQYAQYTPDALLPQQSVDAKLALKALTDQVMMTNLADAKARVGQSFGSMQVSEWDKFTQQLTSLNRGLSEDQAAKSMKYVLNFIKNKRAILNKALNTTNVIQSDRRSLTQDTISQPATPGDFNARWATLKSGQSLVGPDGKTYTKK